MTVESGCDAQYPDVDDIEVAVGELRRLYPEDHIEWRGGGRQLAEQAVEAARWAHRLAGATSCSERKLAAAAALFTELIKLHPLIDGNKRLATVMLWAFLKVNGLPTPSSIAEAALKVASCQWSQEEAHRWLLEELKS